MFFYKNHCLETNKFMNGLADFLKKLVVLLSWKIDIDWLFQVNKQCNIFGIGRHTKRKGPTGSKKQLLIEKLVAGLERRTTKEKSPNRGMAMIVAVFRLYFSRFFVFMSRKAEQKLMKLSKIKMTSCLWY